MLINFKVKTLDAQTHDLSIDNELTVRELKDKIAEKTNIVPEQQRIIYCGRVLADEKQMKDYDVDGKVLHVAERPPPSQGGPTSRTNDNPPPRERSTLRGMRNSPLFRALDSMVTGLPNNGGPPINPFASSSSFCMNRITVARHMLDCANNIAAYLENPERGLNNSSLDILQRGRWTIESTVVEVGITAADLPQNQNIVEMVQGAVSAALRGSGGTNVTVLQLPTVFEQQDNESGGGVTSNSITAGAAGLHAGNDAAALAGVGGGGVGSTSSDTGTSGNAAATVILEDMSDSDDEQLEVQYNRPSESGSREDGQSSSSRDNVTPASSMEANVGSSSNTDVSTTATSSSSTGTNTDQSSSVPGNRRRTPPTVLAEVIELWRNVQARLNPFIQQYYELLQNEPTFEENSTERESAQRLFDRVSEAFHYLSHAQHAISDLMLDLTQPTPRFLTCHPILVEQSGYISSNNFLSAGPAQAAAASAANLVRGHLRGRPAANMLTQQQRQTQTDYVRRNVNSTATNTNISGNVQSAAATSTSGRFEDPVDEAPTTMAPRPPSMNVGTQSSDHGQLPMARLIQAVVNSAPIDTEFHVQINAPIVSFGVPVHVATVHTDAPNQVQQHSSISAAVEAVVSAAARQAAQTAAASAAAANATATSTTTAAAATTTGGNTTTTTAVAAATATTTANNTQTRSRAGSDQVRVTTATLPTTSTQTRSTSRPQLQIGQLPPGTFNGTRFVPNSMMSSFDRFLQCNSHHIRESENASAAPGSGGGGSNNGTNATNTPQIGMHSQIITPQGLQLGTNGANGAAAGVMFPSPFLNMSSSGARPTIGRARPSLASVTRELPPIPTSDNPEENRRVFLNMLSDIRQHLDTLPNARLIMPELASELDELAAAGSAATNATTPSTAAAGAGASTTQAAAPRSNSSSNSTTPRRQAPSAAAAAASTAAASSTASAPAPAAAGSASSAPRPLLAALPNVFAVEAYRINLRTQLLNFLTERIFQGNEINEETIPTAVSRAIHWFSDMIIFLPQYEKPQYNSRASVVNILRSTLPLFINLVNDRQQSNVQFEQRLKQIFEQFIRRLYCVMCQCIGDNNTELYWMQLMRALLVPLRSNFRDEALQFLCVYINTRTPFVPGVDNNHDAQQFIVKRSIALENNQDSSSDVDMNEVASTSASASARDSADETLPSVVAGSEPWHINFPNDWLPLITRDVQALNETPSAQPPYSDAYIAGMATKRRKVLQTNKPPATVNGLLANNVRCALQATENVTPLTATPTTATTTTEAGTGSGGGGSPTAAAADSTSTSTTITTAAAATDDAAAGSLQGASVTPTATATATTSTDTSATATDDSATTTSQEQSPANSHLEEIINSIVNDTSVQASYAEALQTSLRERLRHDNDYDSSKFPEIGKYLNNK